MHLRMEGRGGHVRIDDRKQQVLSCAGTRESEKMKLLSRKHQPNHHRCRDLNKEVVFPGGLSCAFPSAARTEVATVASPSQRVLASQ